MKRRGRRGRTRRRRRPLPRLVACPCSSDGQATWSSGYICCCPSTSYVQAPLRRGLGLLPPRLSCSRSQGPLWLPDLLHWLFMHCAWLPGSTLRSSARALGRHGQSSALSKCALELPRSPCRRRVDRADEQGYASMKALCMRGERKHCSEASETSRRRAGKRREDARRDGADVAASSTALSLKVEHKTGMAQDWQGPSSEPARAGQGRAKGDQHPRLVTKKRRVGGGSLNLLTATEISMSSGMLKSEPSLRGGGRAEQGGRGGGRGRNADSASARARGEWTGKREHDVLCNERSVGTRAGRSRDGEVAEGAEAARARRCGDG